MKLYVCWGTFKNPVRPGGHPCRNAHEALKKAGHNPVVVKSYGLGVLPAALNRTAGRQDVRQLTGKTWVPTLLLGDGTVVDGSQAIIAWAGANPA